VVKKSNKFNIKEFDNNKITLEELRKKRSPLALFFIKNGKLIFAISFLFSITVFLIAFYFVMINIGKSSIVMYESNGVKVTFDSSDNSLLNGTPITESYANKVFTSAINITSDVGVVIKTDELYLEESGKTIVYYSDKSVLIKYNTGDFLRVYPVDGDYGITENGNVNSKAENVSLKGYVEKNDDLDISILYLSDGSLEVTKGNTTFFVRNSDITNTKEYFYTNLSGVSLPVDKVKGNTIYSDGTIKENNGIIVDGKRYEKINKVNVYKDIKIIYYENGYAEVVKNNLSIMVKNSDHIIYDDDSLEIMEDVTKGIEIKDIMDIKEIELNNTNNENAHYIIVLEETDDYKRHKIDKRLDNRFIRFNVYVDNNKYYNNVLDNNLNNSTPLDGIDLNNNTYLLHEGNIEKMSSTTVKLGLWIDYENITNEYMDSAFIGTVKVYVESLS